MQLLRQKGGSNLFIAIDQQKSRNTTPLQAHIAFIMPCFKGIGSRHKSGTRNNEGMQGRNPRDNRCFNWNNCHSKRNKLSLTVIYISPPLDNLVINPYQLSSVCQQSSSSSQNTPRNNRCYTSKESNSKINDFPSLVIPVPPTLNDSVINPTHLSLVRQQSSSSSHNTTRDIAEVTLWRAVFLCRCKLRHINHASINIATSIIGRHK